ncbi:unannotated protein [freshwater metagenome]|uniref:Unannotated protein n=1 Tax=freshwater metagenome TaxID=449393 RepID=A0A6J6UKE0_9ZZZZ|nr:hypothetical protein [Actinomycetota bacterium]
MDAYQFVVPTSLYVRLAIEAVVTLLLSGWLIAHWRRAWWSIIGSLAALAWAVEVAALAFGYSAYDDSAPGWASWIIDHSESLDWVRVVAMTVTVAALALLSRVPRRT